MLYVKIKEDDEMYPYRELFHWGPGEFVEVPSHKLPNIIYKCEIFKKNFKYLKYKVGRQQQYRNILMVNPEGR